MVGFDSAVAVCAVEFALILIFLWFAIINSMSNELPSHHSHRNRRRETGRLMCAQRTPCLGRTGRLLKAATPPPPPPPNKRGASWFCTGYGSRTRGAVLGTGAPMASSGSAGPARCQAGSRARTCTSSGTRALSLQGARRPSRYVSVDGGTEPAKAPARSPLV